MKMIKLQYALVVACAIAASLLPEQPAFAAPVLLLFYFPIRNHVRRQFTRITLSGDNFRFDTGVLSRTTRNIQLSKVQDARVDQTLFQRMMGSGTLSIETAGEHSRLVVPNIDDPQTVAEQLLQGARKAARQKS